MHTNDIGFAFDDDLLKNHLIEIPSHNLRVFHSVFLLFFLSPSNMGHFLSQNGGSGEAPVERAIWKHFDDGVEIQEYNSMIADCFQSISHAPSNSPSTQPSFPTMSPSSTQPSFLPSNSPLVTSLLGTFFFVVAISSGTKIANETTHNLEVTDQKMLSDWTFYLFL